MSLTQEIEEVRAKRLDSQSRSRERAVVTQKNTYLSKIISEVEDDNEEDDEDSFTPELFNENILGELGSSTNVTKTEESSLSNNGGQGLIDCDSGSSIAPAGRVAEVAMFDCGKTGDEKGDALINDLEQI